MKAVSQFGAILLASIFLLTGCSSSGSGSDPDVDDAAAHILDQVTFQDSLIHAQGEVAENYYMLSDAVTDHAIYISGSGGTTEEIAVLQTKDASGMEEARTIIQTRIDSLKRAFQDYRPEQMQKLENPVIVERGNLIYLVLADDPEQASRAIEGLYA